LNNYRTIAATDTKASTKELELELLRHASRCKGNQEASGESIERHELHSRDIPVNRFLSIVVSRALQFQPVECWARFLSVIAGEDRIGQLSIPLKPLKDQFSVPLESVKTSFQRLEQRLSHLSVMPVTFQSFDNSRGRSTPADVAG
jgi:hypothetical protein